MTAFSFGPYSLQADTEATRGYYAAHPQPWITCPCPDCRSFAASIPALPGITAQFLATLGLDPAKPANLSFREEADASLLSGSASYAVSGVLTEGLPAPGHAFGPWLGLEEGFSVAFAPDCGLTPEGFPSPCFQLELSFRLPRAAE